jgi:hypothetical protein
MSATCTVTMSKIGLTKRRKIYATSEERKQRNRQAQAAFRERRTEYIKQLESTIKHHEETLQNLQNSHRNAADECLMLRYKNSLLERILLEKGALSLSLSFFYRGPIFPLPYLLSIPLLPFSPLGLLTHRHCQALMSRLSCAQRLAVQIWGRPVLQRLQPRLPTSRRSSSAPF